MTAQDLLRASDLKGAIANILEEVRSHPADARRRTFLFELLCFAGDYQRAARQLTVLADDSPEAGVGSLLYRSALSASQKREALFGAQNPLATVSGLTRPGMLNGQAFQTITDCDSRTGARLEVFIAGESVWLPFEHLGALQLEPPRLLRDTLWPAAQVIGGPGLQGRDFGEVLLPVLYPFSWQHPKDSVKLGRETVWADAGTAFGQKLLLLDGERVVPYLEIRELRFDSAPQALSTLPTAQLVDNEA